MNDEPTTCEECLYPLTGDDVERVVCGHEGFHYCMRSCANAACRQCYLESLEP